MRNIRWYGWIGLILLIATVLFTMVPSSTAAPVPNVVPGGWQLDFKYDKINVIGVRAYLQEKVKYYWYVRYKVTNNTGRDRTFVPDIWLLTDAGDVVLANDKNIIPTVFTQIKKRSKNPLLERPAKIVGKLLQGEDNARESVAIWQVPDHDVDMLRIFVGGLSGETHRMHKITEIGDTKLVAGTYVAEKTLVDANIRIAELNNRAKATGGTGDEHKAAQAETLSDVLMRKTFMLEYHSPGDLTHVRLKPFVLRKHEWIVR
jgi:hypothetical protein